MKVFLMFMVALALAIATIITPASAQSVPTVVGLTPFTAETKYMSLAGYLRWQYHVENQVWISRAEAVALVKAQSTTR